MAGRIKQLQFSEGIAVDQPTEVGMVASGLKTFADDAAFLAAKGSAAAAGDIYFNTASGTIREYDGSAWREIADLSSTQTMSGKTLSNPTVTGFMDMSQQSSTPAAPASGSMRVYPKTDGKLYKQSSAGIETEIGSGSGGGSGEINLVYKNPSGASDTSGWVTSGGATITRLTSGPLDPATPTGFRIAGTTVGSYVEFPLNIPQALAVKLKAEWYQAPESGASSGEWKVDILNSSSTRYPLTTDSSSVTSIPALTGKFTTYVHPTAGASQKIRFTRVSGTKYLDITNVIVGPGIQPQGAAKGDWRALTVEAGNGQAAGKLRVGATTTAPTFGSTVWSEAWWCQDGADMLIRLGYGQNTAGTAGSGTYLFHLPSGYTIDSTRVGTSGNSTRAVVGSAEVEDTAKAYTGSVQVNSTTSLFLVVGNETSTPSTFNSAFVSWANATLRVGFEARVPIAEWAGSGTVNLAQNDVTYYSGTGTWGTSSSVTTVQGGPGSQGGSTTPSGSFFQYTITPTTPVPTGCTPVIQLSTDRVNWSNVGSPIGIGLVESLRSDGTNFIGANAYVNTSGNIVVTFGKYMSGTSLAWNGTWYWRVAIAQPGQAVGFGEVVPGVSSGLVSASGLKGRTDGTSIATGYVGETYTSGTPSEVDQGNATNTLATLSNLPAGIWQIRGYVYGIDATDNIRTLAAAISTSSSFSPVVNMTGDNSGTYAMCFNGSTGTRIGGVCEAPGATSISSATTYYLRCTTTVAAAGVVALKGKIVATRIA